MQHFILWTPTVESSAQPVSPDLMADLGGYFQEVAAATVLAGGLLPMSQGGRVEITDGDALVTDGPFAEAKEVVAGFSVVEADSREQALGWATRFAQIHADHGWEGTCEVRPLMPATPPGA